METDMERWWRELDEVFERSVQGRRISAFRDPYACNLAIIDEYFNEPRVTDEEHAFKLFVKGELSEERYLHWRKHFHSKRLTPEQEHIQRIRNMPKIKQRMTRLKPWE